MRNRFDDQLDQLNSHLLKMGALIESSIRSATLALVKQDVSAAKQAIVADQEVDQKEREIESLCIKMILQQQPVAKDLRFISAANKMITDMERIGDQAADIADIIIYIADQPFIKEIDHLPRMSQKVIEMVRGSLDAYVNKDLALARSVIKMDDEIDELFTVVKHELIDRIHMDANTGPQAMDLLLIAKYYERIGDHAENIAEWVEFALTGKHKGVFLT